MEKTKLAINVTNNVTEQNIEIKILNDFIQRFIVLSAGQMHNNANDR